ncbi:hypothetical protein QZH41_012812, partial [Actinostola sp. cb2023]
YDDTVNNVITWSCSESALLPTLNVIRDELNVINMTVQPLSKVPIPMTGSGRLCTLTTPVSLDTLITHVKNHLQLK